MEAGLLSPRSSAACCRARRACLPSSSLMRGGRAARSAGQWRPIVFVTLVRARLRVAAASRSASSLTLVVTIVLAQRRRRRAAAGRRSLLLCRGADRRDRRHLRARAEDVDPALAVAVLRWPRLSAARQHRDGLRRRADLAEHRGSASSAACVGTAIGVLPGIGPLTTMAMILPFTFWLSAGRRADHAVRRVLRRAVRRLDHRDPGQDSRRDLVGRHHARRPRHGAAGPRRPGARDRGARARCSPARS